MNAIRGFFPRLWSRLSRRNSAQPLSRFALIVLFALDIFVLVEMMDGLTNAVRLIERPRNQITLECAEVSLEFVQLDASARLKSIGTYLAPHSEERARLERDFGLLPSPLKTCQTLYSLFLATINNEELIALYGDFQGRSAAIRATEEKIADLKKSYQAALLEKVARQSRTDSILPASASDTKNHIARFENELGALQAQQASTKAALESHPVLLGYLEKVKALLAVGELQQAQRKFEHEVFTYPFRVMAIQIGFMLPLLLLAVFWNVRAIRRQDDNKILVSSHFMLVCMIPIFIRVLQFVYELLPNYLMETILIQLEQTNLMFLLNYGVILAGLGGGLLLIFIAQRTYFKPARQRVLRLRKVQCLGCGEKLASSEQACCEVCGSEQLGICRHCGLRSRALAFYCQHCGTARD
ncbi:hypothetical protein GTP23_08445 [Pseudoduganella sp. FT93W]|uniref:Zinc ribbon domain-containing protein n=1 Tax=Duganella fentianensis TaxID=2692177 RepID=A0A845HVE5_9BURK|nr:hypothetical protein [Duganella fentianensis]MYN45090.1 hypothetical protein [Duganella fentianensis]